jgi:putative flippase GtrA
MTPEKNRDEIKKDILKYFAIGWTTVIVGFAIFLVLMPRVIWPIQADFWVRLSLASAVTIVVCAIGGFFSLLGFLKIIDYAKAK